MILRRRPRSLSAPRVAALSGGVGAGLVATLVGLSACSGGGGGGPEVTVVAAATSTTFRTEPVRTTTTTVAPPPEPDDADTGSANGDTDEGASPDPTGEQSYEIRGGDYLVGIAQRFDVTADAIAEYNGWESLQHPLQPGDTILIPPQDWDPDEAAPGSTGDDVASTDGGEADADDGTCPDGSEQQTYTIRSGDVKGTVARRFDITVSELDAANANTQYYAGFVIGIEILIPC